MILRFTLFAIYCLQFGIIISQSPEDVLMIDPYGGESGIGRIWELDSAGCRFDAVYDFNVTNPGTGTGERLLEASDGKLYGLGQRGEHGGVIYSYDPLARTYNLVFEFDGCLQGYMPSGALIEGGDGKIYGMTKHGGVYGFGVIFSFNPLDGQFLKIHDFNGLDGKQPSGGLVIDDNNRLIGCTPYGGINDRGVLFSLNLLNLEFVKHIDFSQEIGAIPLNNLIRGSDNQFYGVTLQGGAYNKGVLFRFDPESNSLLALFDFDENNGKFPRCALTEGPQGVLYGMAQGGDNGYSGVIFSFNINSNDFQKLYDFANSGIQVAQGSLAFSSDGNLYSTANGGSYSYGVIFRYSILNNTVESLHEFNFTDSIGAGAIDMMQASNGLFYGTTQPNTFHNGTIYSWDSSSNSILRESTFGLNQGIAPTAKLVLHPNNRHYGLTSNGGRYGAGTIYSIDFASNDFRVEFNFDDIQGYQPQGSLILANDGQLYGITTYGGIHSIGVLFVYDPVSLVYSKLYDFGSDSLGAGLPQGSLIQAENGKLYGLNQYAVNGIDYLGSLFSYDIDSSSYAEEYIFQVTDGYLPYGSLLETGNSILYGLTSIGGANGYNDGGTLFSFDANSHVFTKIADIRAALGLVCNQEFCAGPRGTLYKSSDSKLYGVTSNGSSNLVVFTYDLQNSILSRLFDFEFEFDSIQYSNSWVDFIDNVLFGGPQGLIYGRTFNAGGGVCNNGYIYQISPSLAQITRFFDFGSGFVDSSFSVSDTSCSILVDNINDSFSGMRYQAIVRDASGSPFANSSVLMRFSVLTDSVSAIPDYIETHTLVTNQFGLLNTAVGNGAPVLGSFAAIDWTNGSKFLKVEADRGSGFVDIGTERLYSVPYAMHALTTREVQNAQLPVYPDNASALSGGLIAGQIYRTAQGQLRIVY
jgi:uncharacterized repeat protein (TIGR03803 family)